MPHVSVIIPAYNRAALVAESIDSVLAQAYRDMEVIVVDDGSTDGTADVLARYGSRLTVLTQPNRGPSAARNLGARHAAGDLIAFQDSDDLWAPGKLAAQVAFLEARPDVAFTFADLRRFNEQGTVYESLFDRLRLFRQQPCEKALDYHYVMTGDVLGYLLEETPIFGQTVLCRRELFEGAGGFRNSISLSEDWDLWLRMARRARFGFTDRVMLDLRQHDGNLSGNLAERILGEAHVLELVAKEDIELTPAQHEVIRRRLAEKHYQAGYEYFRENDLSSTREQCEKALVHDPDHCQARRLLHWTRVPRWLVRTLRAGREAIRWGARANEPAEQGVVDHAT